MKTKGAEETKDENGKGSGRSGQRGAHGDARGRKAMPPPRAGGAVLIHNASNSTTSHLVLGIYLLNQNRKRFHSLTTLRNSSKSLPNMPGPCFERGYGQELCFLPRATCAVVDPATIFSSCSCPASKSLQRSPL
jgi:hypothetical protein